MSVPIGPSHPALALTGLRWQAAAARPFPAPDGVEDLTRPTPEARELIARAADVADLLGRLDRTIAFVPDGAGSLHAEVRDGSGALVQRLSVSDALTLLDGLGSG